MTAAPWVNVGERILLTLWVGGTWTVGYLVAPTLFAVLDDRALAGSLAGHMFRTIGVITLVVCVTLLVIMAVRDGVVAVKRWRGIALVLAVAITAGSLFVLQPAIQELRGEGIVPGTEQAAQFGKMHGLSSGLYLVVSLLGLALVAAGTQGAERSVSPSAPGERPSRPASL